MLYGTSKPKIQLRNADNSLNDEITLQYAQAVEPNFEPENLEHKTQDGIRTVFNRGWWPDIDLFWPFLSDAEYATLVHYMKSQYDIDTTTGKTRYIRIYPRSDKTYEYYDGFITTPIKVLNQFHFITHGAKVKFEGKKRLSKGEFLKLAVTDLELSWPGTIATGTPIILTAVSSPIYASQPITWEWRINTVLKATHTDQDNTDSYTHTFVSGEFPAGQANKCHIEITAINGAGSYAEQANVEIGQVSL